MDFDDLSLDGMDTWTAPEDIETQELGIDLGEIEIELEDVDPQDAAHAPREAATEPSQEIELHEYETRPGWMILLHSLFFWWDDDWDWWPGRHRKRRKNRDRPSPQS